MAKTTDGRRNNCRFTKYSEEVLKKTDEYIAQAIAATDKLPKIESLALYLNVERKTLYNWAKKPRNKEFKRRLKKIMDLQYERLVDDGIYGGKNINPPIIKIMLVNNHNMKSDRIDNNFSGELENKFTDEQINKIASRIARRQGITGSTPSKK